MIFWVYVLKNTQTNRIYIGQTNNLEDRLKRHNRNLPQKKSSYTYKNKQDGLWQLVYSEQFDSRQAVKIREKELKSYQGRLFIKNKISR